VTDGAVAPAQLMIPAAELARRVDELGAELVEVYGNAPEPPIFVGVLKGSALFFADLVRAARIDVAVDFMSISSYSAAAPHSGVVRIVKDLDQSVAGRDVLIVEDIVDTGLTLTYLRRTLMGRSPRSLRTVTLLDKSARRILPVELEHTGFEIPDVFVVGYGLDFQGRYRNVPDLLSVEDLPRLANDPLLLVAGLFSPAPG
jgi:hypoxanthine phosphoribosyltransferase